MLNITATASLALPSAVCVAPRTQSQRSQRPASFGRRCPQYGHGILSPVVGLGWAGGASVYSTFILSESHKPHGIRQARRRRHIIAVSNRSACRGLPALPGSCLSRRLLAVASARRASACYRSFATICGTAFIFSCAVTFGN